MIDIAAALEEIALSTAPSSTDAGPVNKLVAALTESMVRSPEQLAADMRLALQEASRRIDRVSVAVTGLAWVGSGTPSVEQQLVRLVRSAKREISLCVYAVTSGAIPLLRELMQVAAQGVTVTFVISSLSKQPDDVQVYLKEAAKALGDRWRILEFDQTDSQSTMHAKILAVDRWEALIGSANLSYRGLVANHEIAVIIRGPTAELIAQRIDLLLGLTKEIRLT